MMLRYLTAGESHGSALVATIEGLPAHVKVSSEILKTALARRRLGAGRGARMKFETDEVTILAGVRHGETLGSPIAVQIANTEWPKWQQVMAVEEVDPELLETGRGAPLTRPRPGHADLVGMQKYDFAEARPILERASARETASRVALGEFARLYLRQCFNIEIISHVVELGDIKAKADRLPGPADQADIDADPLRAFGDQGQRDAMLAEIADCTKAGDTVGGVVEVVAWGMPPGLGSHIQGDRRLDAKLAGALMGIPAIKGVEFGDGFASARRRGSAVHDEMMPTPDGISRLTQHSGGTEGGMSTGEPLRVRAAMKPIATVPKALRTLDTATGEAASAHHQRSDVCAVPAAGVIAEAMTALVIADLALEKFGGDSVSEVQRNYRSYLDQIARRGLNIAPEQP